MEPVFVRIDLREFLAQARELHPPDRCDMCVKLDALQKVMARRAPWKTGHLR